jgi:hypothetical protein
MEPSGHERRRQSRVFALNARSTAALKLQCPASGDKHIRPARRAVLRTEGRVSPGNDTHEPHRQTSQARVVPAERRSHSQQTSVAGTTRSSRDDAAVASDRFGRVPTARKRVRGSACARPGAEAGRRTLRVQTMPVRGDADLHDSQPHRAAADDPVQRVLEPVQRARKTETTACRARARRA